MFRTSKTYHRQGALFLFIGMVMVTVLLMGRLGYLMIYQADYYGAKAEELHERERKVKAKRGNIYDRNGVLLAGNKSVSTISVIHNQIKDEKKVIEVLAKELEMDEETIRDKVKKVSALERIKSNVDKETSDRIRNYGLEGVTVDEDYKRYYVDGKLASKVIGFTGADNQGIIGLEVAYEDVLKGIDGAILTQTTASGIEIENVSEDRKEPVSGKNLVISLDANIQKYAQQAAERVLKAKEAKSVRIILMNPQNGEILAMVNVPEFDLNSPYEVLGKQTSSLTEEKQNELLNQMWRNACVCDTYEPGSTFKIITMSAALENDKVTLEDAFYCPGYKIVEDRRIRCHKTTGHGSQTFIQGVQNSCNPVFMEIGARLGVNMFFTYLKQFQIIEKTGIDIPGEASTIMHKQENVGAVELATMSFGQSFQLTPIRLMTTVSALINGGTIITPHFGMQIESENGEYIETLQYNKQKNIVSKETSADVRTALESVVSVGTGNKAAVQGYKTGAKTGTSEKLPRSSNKYIASCISFAPADNPQVLALVLIDEPTGIYYGGTIAAPVISEIFDDVLPYLGIQPSS